MYQDIRGSTPTLAKFEITCDRSVYYSEPRPLPNGGEHVRSRYEDPSVMSFRAYSGAVGSCMKYT